MTFRNEELLNKLLNSKVKHAVVAANTVKHFWHNVDATGASGFAAPAEIEFVKFNPPKHLSPRRQKRLRTRVRRSTSVRPTADLPPAHGKGNANVYPSLVGSPWVNGSEERLVKMALHGMWGKIDGARQDLRPGPRRAADDRLPNLLNDEELAAVLTFVRNTWGNEAPTIRRRP